MEHDTDNIWDLPQEINELIFNLTSVSELCNLREVSKSIRASLINQRIWKDACVREFDLEFIDENSNWIQLAAKYGAIGRNIRRARVLVHALAVNMIRSDRLYTGESYIKDDERIIVNWLRTYGRGSGAMDFSDHSAILNVHTRKEEQSFKLDKKRSLVTIGNRFAELDWEGYNIRPDFTNIAFKSDGHFEQTIPTTQMVRTILSNPDPNKKHIVLIADSGPQRNWRDCLVLKIYDMNEQRIVNTFSIKNFSQESSVFYEVQAFLHGDFIYALQVSTLHVLNWTSGVTEGDQIEIPFHQPKKVSLLGAHKSLVFGFCTGFVWLFDVKKKTLQQYECADFKQRVTNMTVNCGVLVAVAGQFMHFMDYRSDPTQLTLISTLQLDEVYRTSLQPMKDGKLFMSGYNSGAKLIDFEHVNDECEILFVRASESEQKSTPMTIKAFELVSRARSLLGTHEFVSRYFKMNSERRFGIIYNKNQDKGRPRLELAYLKRATQKKPEYNTPFMYHKMMFNSAYKEQERIVWAVPGPAQEFYGSVIIFYEEWTGTRWRLSKPSNWTTSLNVNKTSK
jgi:hypothetical protein